MTTNAKCLDLAMGFSRRQGRPLAHTASACSRWHPTGDATYTALTSGSLRSLPTSSYDLKDQEQRGA